MAKEKKKKVVLNPFGRSFKKSVKKIKRRPRRERRKRYS
jgi:hypothetical protein